MRWNPLNRVVQCHRCGQVHEAAGITRRRFFFLGLGAAASAIVVPRLEVFAPLIQPIPTSSQGVLTLEMMEAAFDRILKQTYQPAIMATINYSYVRGVQWVRWDDSMPCDTLQRIELAQFSQRG